MKHPFLLHLNPVVNVCLTSCNISWNTGLKLPVLPDRIGDLSKVNGRSHFDFFLLLVFGGLANLHNIFNIFYKVLRGPL